jgi:mannose-6-phosphate isomerase-like protein (cupin superfamily)
VLFRSSDNIIVINLKTDTGQGKGHGNATLYIDDIRFLDASGNLITADTTVAFNPPAGYADTGVDMTHMVYLKDVVDLEGFAVSADGWSQAGVDITEDIQNLLVPGSYVEIEYSSESGEIWLVVTGAANGWVRINNDGKSVKNTSKSMAQISYEDIMAACGGADSSALTGQIQCESDTPWEVFGVRIGKDSGLTDLKKATILDGFAVSADAWSQAGVDITADIQELLVPGSVVEIEYTSESGEMWVVITGAANGWVRVNDAGSGMSRNNGRICQVPYEDIMAACGGADSSALTGQIQCESDTAWEVFGVSIGMSAN